MSRTFTTVATLVWALAGAISCQQSPIGPSGHAGTVGQLVESVRQQGLTVSLGGEISSSRNGFFTVPARQVLVGRERLSAFEYPTTAKASADAALISSDAQPNPRVAIGWVSTPRFYRQPRLIVLYVGCSGDVIAALEKSLGLPVATGQTPCR